MSRPYVSVPPPPPAPTDKTMWMADKFGVPACYRAGADGQPEKLSLNDEIQAHLLRCKRRRNGDIDDPRDMT